MPPLDDIVGLGLLEIGLVAIPLTIFAKAGVINGIDTTDRIDGLSAGLVFIAAFFLGFLAYDAGDVAILELSTLLMSDFLAFPC